jgi:hypothetical protein
VKDGAGEARARIAGFASELLAGGRGVVETARLIVAWQKRADDRHADWLVFAGIAAETDQLPSEPVLDGERLLYEERHRGAALEAARRLFARYGVTTDDH